MRTYIYIYIYVIQTYHGWMDRLRTLISSRGNRPPSMLSGPGPLFPVTGVQSFSYFGFSYLRFQGLDFK